MNESYCRRKGLMPVLLITAYLWPGFVSGQQPVIYYNPSHEIYKHTLQFDFSTVDSLIQVNENQFSNNPAFNLAVINFYWWKLITGSQNVDFSVLINERIRKYGEHSSKIEDGSEDEELFHLISVYAYSARVKLLDNSYLAALGDLSRYNALLKKSFGRETEYEPFYLTSGLYYYFSSYARERVPVVSAFLADYSSRNMETGLRFLRKAARSENPVVYNEARYFLMKIAFDIQKNYPEAAKYCQSLLNDFPDNLLYQLYMIRINLGLGQAQRANIMISQLEKCAFGNQQLSMDEKTHFLNQARTEYRNAMDAKE